MSDLDDMRAQVRVINDKTEALWSRVNKNSDTMNSLLTTTTVTNEILADVRSALREIHQDFKANLETAAQMQTRLALLEDSERNRRGHIRALWGALTAALVGWLAQHFTFMGK